MGACCAVFGAAASPVAGLFGARSPASMAAVMAAAMAAAVLAAAVTAREVSRP